MSKSSLISTVNGTITNFDEAWNQLYEEAIIPLINFLENINSLTSLR